MPVEYQLFALILEKSFHCFKKKYFFPEATIRGVLYKKVFLEIWQKFTGKHLCQSLFFNKVAGLIFLKQKQLTEC